MSQIEAQRMIAMQKHKQRANRQKRVDLGVWRKQNEEAMAHFKTKLKQSIKNNDITDVKKCLHTLYKLRSEQLQILFYDYKNRYGEPTEGFAEQQIAKYYSDCYLLTQKTQKVLNLQHARSQ